MMKEELLNLISLIENKTADQKEALKTLAALSFEQFSEVKDPEIIAAWLALPPMARLVASLSLMQSIDEVLGKEGR
jgi:hypothetical protein